MSRTDCPRCVAALVPLALLGCSSCSAPQPAPPAASIVTAPVASASAEKRAPLASVELPGGAAGIGFDDLRFSAELGKVLVPAGRSGNLDLVDPTSGQVTAVGGFKQGDTFAGGHDFGVTSVDRVGTLLYATDRTSQRLDVVDASAAKIIASQALAAEPDYVRWVAKTGEAWVTEPDEDQIEVFAIPKAATDAPKSVAKIATKGGPESLVIDSTRGRAYAHLWKGKTIAIDVATRAVVETWPNGCDGSRGIALDEPRGWLVAGCSEGKATVLDVAHGGKILGEARDGDGVDIIDYDPRLGHVYLPGAKSATMAILGVSASGGLTVLGSFPTATGAHCVTVDDRGRAFVCDPSHGKLLVVDDPYPPSAAATKVADSGDKEKETEKPAVFAFDEDTPGSAPAGFSFGRTGGGRAGRWVVGGEKDAPSAPNVLEQLDADTTDYRFPVAVADSPVVADASISVRCKPVAGNGDRACGLVFRYAGENDYYVTRANALENNVRFYRVIKGKREQVDGWNGSVTSGVWHELRVDAKGDRFQIYWDKKKVLESTDKTFPGPGKVGVWTKADSVTWFDDLRVAIP